VGKSRILSQAAGATHSVRGRCTVSAAGFKTNHHVSKNNELQTARNSWFFFSIDVLASVTATHLLSSATPGHEKLTLYIVQSVIMRTGHKITATLNIW